MEWEKRKRKEGKGFDGGGRHQTGQMLQRVAGIYKKCGCIDHSNCIVLLHAKVGDITQEISHKGIGFLSEEELDLVSGCARGMEEDTGSNSDRVGEVLDLVLFRVKVVE